MLKQIDSLLKIVSPKHKQVNELLQKGKLSSVEVEHLNNFLTEIDKDLKTIVQIFKDGRDADTSSTNEEFEKIVAAIASMVHRPR
jgi:bisphosphoglycerate-independent phosphoglycerate mutase (AlkP superfamily)